MSISIMTTPGRRAAQAGAQPYAVNTVKKAVASAAGQDEVVISREAQEAMALDGIQETGTGSVTSFTSFAQEFSKVTQRYTNIIREHYAGEHAENLASANPKVHIWDKYKNPDSPDFRADMLEDERAWAYDQELDLLNGGKHLQMGNPYAFPGGAPTLASAAMEANRACREQISQSVQDLLAQNGIDLPEDASFRLTVDASNYTIHVSGLEDEELAASIEQALNTGDNGKNLCEHLKVTTPNGEDLGVDYTDGRLEALDPRQELDDDAMAEVKKQTCPAYSRFSGPYDPHHEPLGTITAPGMDPPSQESLDRAAAIFRMGAPEMLARDRAGEFEKPRLECNPYAAADPDGSIIARTYIQAYARQAADAKKAIEDYYAAANRENSSYSFAEGVQHIREKYKLPDSGIFRSDLTVRQRDMYYRQEMALLTGGTLTMLDPYALASIGGVQSVQGAHQAAMQAVREKIAELQNLL